MSGRIRRTPKPLRIMLGTVLIGLGAYLYVSYLPTRKPLTTEERGVISHQAGVDETRWRLTAPLYLGAQGAAGGFVFIGLLVAVRGAFFRPRQRVRCRRCQTEVLADVERFRKKCPNGNHSARTSFGTIFLLVLFLLDAAGLAALLVIGAFMGVT